MRDPAALLDGGRKRERRGQEVRERGGEVEVMNISNGDIEWGSSAGRAFA